MPGKVKSPFDNAEPAPDMAPKDPFEGPAEAPKVTGLPRATPLKAKLTGVYGFIGAGVFAFDPYCGAAILQSAEATAEAMDQLARESPAVKRVLEGLVATSAIGTAIAAHMPIIMAIMAHHGPDNVKELVGRFAAAEQVSE